MFCKSVNVCVIIPESHLLSLNCITYYILAFYRPPHNSWPPPSLCWDDVHEWSSKERTTFLLGRWYLRASLSWVVPIEKWHRGFLHCFLLYKSVAFVSGCKTCFTEGFRRFLRLGIIDLFRKYFLSSTLIILSYRTPVYQVKFILGFPKLAKYLCLYFMFWILSTPHLFPSLHTCIHKHILLSNRTLF